MHRYLTSILAATTVLALTAGPAAATSDGPFFAPPHGLLQPILNSDNKIVVLQGAGIFAGLGALPMNQAGQTILPHDFAGTVPGIIDGHAFPKTAGGIAERLAGFDSASAPFAFGPDSLDTAGDAEFLQADDPGFLMGALPDGFLLKATFIGPLRIFDDATMAFTAPTGGERLRISDFDGIDIATNFSGASPASNVAILDATSVGDQGTINVGVSGFLNDGTADPGGVIHAHIRYELDRAGGGIPEHNPYLIELRLSAEAVMSAGDGSDGSATSILDSDSIFILFDNQSAAGVFDDALAVAVAMPEPATALIVAGSGLWLLGFRRNKK